MLKVKIPAICLSEQRYVLDILLGDFLGLAFDVEIYHSDLIEITRTGNKCGPSSVSKLTFDATFFHKISHAWLKSESMPVLPLENWTPVNDGIKANLVRSQIPVLYGKQGLIKSDEHLHINLDIFGSAFFMLSRYEELITKDRDSHDRFPASASIAYKAGFLDRPIVNEYLEILWECLHLIWPDLTRKKRTFRKLISCDVDFPFDFVGYSLKKTMLRIGGRLLRDKNPKLALFDGLNYVFKKFGSDYFDEYTNNIDWIMKVNEEAGNKVAFNFIPIQTDPNREDLNDVRSKKISGLLKHIVTSGHEIGFHPGYKTYKFTENFQHSASVLKEACKNKGIDDSKLGGRQHYLRYDVSLTPKLWQDNGFIYDSSLGYVDIAGFRCGVCYEYSMYDLGHREKMLLKQRPLIAMELTVIGQLNKGLGVERVYEGLGFTQESIKRFERLKGRCQQFDGDYVLLWHNSYLSFKLAKSQYLKAL